MTERAAGEQQPRRKAAGALFRGGRYLRPFALLEQLAVGENLVFRRPARVPRRQLEAPIGCPQPRSHAPAPAINSAPISRGDGRCDGESSSQGSAARQRGR
jgi:hypothetical protein